jgi:type II secretory pathway pseudopilin PulG
MAIKKQTTKGNPAPIELLVVIVIIGILFVVLISKVDFATDKAKTSGVQTDFRSFQMAFDTVAREQAGFSSLVGDNYGKLETAINKNLDAKLHIDIDDSTGEITMLNGALDPWKMPYHGVYIAGTDGKDRGAMIMYSNGANLTFGSEATIAGGVVTITSTNDDGKDDYAIVSCYSLANGSGEVKTSTSGFSQNQNNNTTANPSNPTVPNEPEQGGNNESYVTPTKNQYGFYYNVLYVETNSEYPEAFVLFDDGTATSYSYYNGVVTGRGDWGYWEIEYIYDESTKTILGKFEYNDEFVYFVNVNDDGTLEHVYDDGEKFTTIAAESPRNLFVG